MGILSPSKARVEGADTGCLVPGLRLSRANGQSNPSVDSISIMGTGGKVFSSAGIQTEIKSQKHSERNTVKGNVYYNLTKHTKYATPVKHRKSLSLIVSPPFATLDSSESLYLPDMKFHVYQLRGTYIRSPHYA